MNKSLSSRMSAGWSLVAGAHAASHARQFCRERADLMPPEDLAISLADSMLDPAALSHFVGEESIAFHTYALSAARPAAPDQAGPAIPPGWMAPVSATWAALLAKLADRDIPDAVLLDTLDQVSADLPKLIEDMDIAALTEVFEAGMGQAAVREALRAEKRLPTNHTKGTNGGVASYAAEADAPSVSFAPMADAVAKLGAKTPIAAKLGSAEWAGVPLALRERGQFSAHVESIRFLGTLQEKLQKRVGMERERVAGSPSKGLGQAFVDRDSFIRDMRRIAQEEGIETTDAAGKGTVRDIHSVKRLGLIYDQQTQSAAGYARWKMDHDVDVLDEFPAYRLGTSTAEKPREESEWLARWDEAGDQVGWAGAAKRPMAALKTSPIWTALSSFGTPWPPFDFGSTRDLEDLDRAAAESLGLLPKDAPVPEFEGGSGREDFNQGLEASTKGLDPAMVDWLKESFGDDIAIDADTVRWAREPTFVPPPPLKIVDAPVRVAPVSHSLDVQVKGKLRHDVEDALRSVDRTIDGPRLPKIPLHDKVSQKNLGHYEHSGDQSVSIGVREDGKWPRLTTAHEVAHFVDHRLSLDGKTRLSETAAAGDWWKAIQDSDTFAGTPAGHSSRRELFARSFAQWTAYRSGNMEMLRDLANVAHDNQPWRQWNATEFKPIAQALENLFSQRGLL